MAKRTQQQRTEESRGRLVDAAATLIGTKGYTGTTLAEIGRHADVSRGLVTYHFGSKEACIRAVVETMRDTTHSSLSNGTNGTRGLSALDRLSENYLHRFDSPAENTIFVVIVESLTSTPELRELTIETDENMRTLIRRLLNEAIEDGEVSAETDADVQAILVLGLLRGVALQWLVHSESMNLDAVVSGALQMIRASLTIGRASYGGLSRMTAGELSSHRPPAG